MFKNKNIKKGETMKTAKFKISSNFLENDMLHKSSGIHYENESKRSYELLEIITKKLYAVLPKSVKYNSKKYKNLELKKEKITDYKEYVKHLNKYYLKPFTYIEVTEEEYKTWYKYWLEFYFDDESYFYDVRSQFNSHDPMVDNIKKPKWFPKKRVPSKEYIESKKLFCKMKNIFGEANFSEDHRAGAKMKFVSTMVKEMGVDNALAVAKTLKSSKLN